eukprot:gene10434-14017_t
MALPHLPSTAKLDFPSHGGSLINLGCYKNKTANNETYRADLLIHTNMTSVGNESDLCAKSGLDQTRFHKGFNRRHVSNISNPSADITREFERTFAKKSMALARARSENLKSIEHQNGYDIITGTAKGKGPLNRVESLRITGSTGVGNDSLKQGKAILNDSPSKFFTPMYSGPKQDYRQDLLHREGLQTGKYTSILQLGKKDMPSYGIEDQFSKSQYTNNSEKTRTGLVEARIPGKYTPRKIENNPSGKQGIVEKWSSSVDISYNTSKCIE